MKNDESQNPTSPYYLHPGENPGAFICDSQLNDSNYHSQSKNIIRAQVCLNKYKFMDGSITEAIKDDPVCDAWERCNHIVVGWAMKTVSKQIAQSVVYIDDAKEL